MNKSLTLLCCVAVDVNVRGTWEPNIKKYRQTLCGALNIRVSHARQF